MQGSLWSVLILSSVMMHKGSGKVGVEGEISFQLQVFDSADRRWKVDDSDASHHVKSEEGKSGEKKHDSSLKSNTTSDHHGQAWEPRGRGHSAGGGVTAAERLECQYQYPEPRHLDAMLGAIMNRLTKLFMRMRQMLNVRRDVKKRFRVVAKRDMFFDRVYANMSDEYRQSVNKTRMRIASKQLDPCSHQKEIRALWGKLLDTSERSLGRAALACIEEYLRTFRAAGSAASGAEGGAGGAGGTGGAGGAEGAGDERAEAQARAAELIRRELARVRNEQLELLCDRFQLCYHDLQKQRKHKTKT